MYVEGLLKYAYIEVSLASLMYVYILGGFLGSGKTTLAAQLAEAFPDSITVHTDDYYLPYFNSRS